MLRPSSWWLAIEPVDLRCGIDRLLVLVQTVFGRDAFDGTAYVFRNRSGTRIKRVLGDATGVWLCVRRLQEGRFRWPRPGETLCEVDAQQFEWLCKGVDWQRLSMTTKGLAQALRSEAMNPEQRGLFDDAVAADIAAVETELEALAAAASTPPASWATTAAR